jgi:hypothetical protein
MQFGRDISAIPSGRTQTLSRFDDQRLNRSLREAILGNAGEACARDRASAVCTGLHEFGFHFIRACQITARGCPLPFQNESGVILQIRPTGIP